MIKSMTGYGKAEESCASGKITAEIRSVNHRYGEISIKMPRSFLACETDVRKIVAERLKRGKIDVFIQYEPLAGAGLATVNIPLATAYYEAFKTLKFSLGLADEITLPMITSQRDVVLTETGEVDVEALADLVLVAVKGAVENLELMRLKEGASLRADLDTRRNTITILLDRIARRSPEVVADYAVRLKDRVAQLLGDTSIDETRMTQEIALMADRCDITEEQVRLGSHLGQFDAAFKLSEPVGRKLDFLLQEMNREVNTIGSKANDAEIATNVVELKAELEKIREQVQNIE